MDVLTPLLPGEHIEVFGRDLPLIVSQAHTFGTDAFLLADFAPKAKLCADLGTGCGVIPYLLTRDRKAQQIWAVDVQRAAIDQLTRSLAMRDGICVEPVLADLRDLPASIPAGTLDLVTMNPPYTAAGAGLLSENRSDAVARHGTACTFDDMCAAAFRLLRFGGSFCVCVRPHRLSELFYVMHDHRVEPKRLRLVCKAPGRAPWLALVEGKAGRNPGLVTEPDLFVHDGDGLSREMRRIMGDYQNKETL